MKQFVEPKVNFETALASMGFTLYGEEWITKTASGTYITLSCYGDDTALEWIQKTGVSITDDEFVEAMCGDAAKYEKLWKLFDVKNIDVRQLFFSGV